MEANKTRTGKGFPSTHWTRVYLASQHDREEGSKALAALLKTYSPALRRYLLHWFPASRAEVDDWLSSFLEQKILEQHLLKRAREDKGRFRNFLLTALKNFAEGLRRRDHRRRRRPSGGLVSLQEARDISTAGSGNHQPTPGDIQWVKTALDRARDKTRDYYRAKGREVTWQIFAAACYRPLRYGDERPSDAELARRHGFESARQISNQIGLAKRRFGSALREVIRDYEKSEAGIDDEIRQLMAIFSGGE